MTPEILYDIGLAGLNDQFWFLVIGSVFGLAWFGGLPLFLARSEQENKNSNYLVAAPGVLFFCVMAYFLTQGWFDRRECLKDFANGDLEVTTNRVTQLRKSGKTPPFRYEFLLGEVPFVFNDSPGGVCGLARPPSGMLFLEEGKLLRIEHRGTRIYRVAQVRQSP